MTEQELQAIEERASKATPGAWIVEAGEYSGRDWMIGSVAMFLGASCWDDKCYTVTTNQVHASELEGDAKTDAEFIAYAREDVPALIAEVKRLRAKLDAMPVEAIRKVRTAAEMDGYTNDDFDEWFYEFDKEPQP